MIWKVPIGLRIGMADGREETIEFLLADETATFLLPQGVEWVLAGSNAKGFYRVSYSQELCDRLIDNLSSLEAVERFNLIDDAWAQTLSNRRSSSDFLRTLVGFRGEENPDVWRAIVRSLTFLDAITVGKRHSVSLNNHSPTTLTSKVIP